MFYLFYADEQKVYYSLPMRLQRSFSLLELYKMGYWKEQRIYVERTYFLCGKAQWIQILPVLFFTSSYDELYIF